ncbi:signal peptidase I [Rarobacter incanus]|uniref:Signal peptidase I n=1 Tax=Rarobacter incanus TaxID=153494 RepID=A0A542SPI8_9MICO|nr:signal peptidase I [Rarobacter incanus]TQK76526.1 signal peptidase [Rarobacter incanus]
MFTVLRRIGSGLLWVVAALGLIFGLVWIATTVGLIKPLIVVSGSMDPEYKVGDLLIDRPIASTELHVGQTASIYTPVIDKTVTHRIVAIEKQGDGTIAVSMKGDANQSADGGPYYPGETAWTPALRIPQVGRLFMALTHSSVIAPAVLALLAMLAFSLIPRDEDDSENESSDPDPNGTATAIGSGQALTASMRGAAAAAPGARSAPEYAGGRGDGDLVAYMAAGRVSATDRCDDR